MAKKNSPKITVNKLGEYLVSTSARQRRILEQLKYPDDNTFSAAAYKDSREAIKSFFLSGFDYSILEKCSEGLSKTRTKNDYQATMRTSEIEAIECVLNSDRFEDEDFEFVEYTGNNERLVIEGVEISVYPDLLVKSNVRNKKNFGALKIHLSKSGKFGDEGGAYIAAILHKYCEEFITPPKGFLIKNTNCISFDVFTDTLIKCPNNIKRRMQEIEAGCKNIVAIWDSI